MDKELDYFEIAGELQAKSYQFNALGLNAHNYIYSDDEQALKYVESLINDFEGYREILKKKIAEREKQEKEERLKERFEYGWQ
jgi:hypothetical protein